MSLLVGSWLTFSRALLDSFIALLSWLQASALDWAPQAAMPRGRRATRATAAMRRFMGGTPRR